MPGEVDPAKLSKAINVVNSSATWRVYKKRKGGGKRKYATTAERIEAAKIRRKLRAAEAKQRRLELAPIL